jgi:hypothetical protein
VNTIFSLPLEDAPSTHQMTVLVTPIPAPNKYDIHYHPVPDNHTIPFSPIFFSFCFQFQQAGNEGPSESTVNTFMDSLSNAAAAGALAARTMASLDTVYYLLSAVCWLSAVRYLLSGVC